MTKDQSNDTSIDLSIFRNICIIKSTLLMIVTFDEGM